MEMLLCILPILLLFFAFSQNQRKQLFARDDATCQDCGRKWHGQGYMLEAHHVNPLNCGGENTIENGVMLCRECHKDRHLRLAANAKSKQEQSANASAARLIEQRIKEKGLKRYGY